MAPGGPRPGAGRKPGTPNKRTQERIDLAQKSGATDPMVSILSLHDWAIKEMKAAQRAVSAFDKEHGKAVAGLLFDVANAKAPKRRQELQKTLNYFDDRRAQLVKVVEEYAARVADYSSRAMPYMHARLASVEASVAHSTHEASLDDLDDDPPADGDAAGA